MSLRIATYTCTYMSAEQPKLKPWHNHTFTKQARDIRNSTIVHKRASPKAWGLSHDKVKFQVKALPHIFLASVTVASSHLKLSSANTLHQRIETNIYIYTCTCQIQYVIGITIRHTPFSDTFFPSGEALHFLPSGAAPQTLLGLPQRLNKERPRPNSYIV